MPLVPAKCPECGGNVVVDNEKEAWVCDFCKTPFIVEKAINNFNTINNITNNVTNNNEIKADVVNVYDESENINNLFARAEEHIQEHRYEQAQNLLNKILDKNTHHKEARDLLNIIPNLESVHAKTKELSALMEYCKQMINGTYIYNGPFKPINRTPFSSILQLYKEVTLLGGDKDEKYKNELRKFFNQLYDLAMDETWCKVSVSSDEFGSAIVYRDLEIRAKCEILEAFLKECMELNKKDDNTLYSVFLESSKIKEIWDNINRTNILKASHKWHADCSVLGYYMLFSSYDADSPSSVYKLGKSIKCENDLERYFNEIREIKKAKEIENCKEKKLCTSCRQKLSFFGFCQDKSCRNSGKKVFSGNSNDVNANIVVTYQLPNVSNMYYMELNGEIKAVSNLRWDI